MNDLQINQKLKDVSNYLGSFAIDELDQIKVSLYPSFIVVNLDKRSSGGSHWIALAIYQNEIFICDSLGGIKPSKSTPPTIIEFLSPFIKNRNVKITRQLQNIYSTTCALFCIVFIKQMSKTNSFDEFIALFTSDCAQNDKLIKFLSGV